MELRFAEEFYLDNKKSSVLISERERCCFLNYASQQCYREDDVPGKLQKT